MAYFLFLVAGVVIGLIAGWLIRGSRTGTAPAADHPTPVESTSSSATGLAESPADTTTAPTTTDSTPATTAPADEPAPAIAEVEPVEETLVVATVEETVVIEPIDETVAIATVVETVEVEAIEVEPIDETVVIEPLDEPTAIEPVTAPADTEPVIAPTDAEPAAGPTDTEPAAVTKPIVREPIAVTEPVAAAADVPVPGAAETDEITPVAAPIAVAVQEPDDLTKIAGIGPKMAMALAAGGITTFSKLAESDLPTLRAAVTGAGMRLAPTLPTWPEQAKLLIGTKS